jgi:molybdopterin/thiamine biosynthesis adenylyltransferase
LIASRAQAPLEWTEPTQFDLTSWADQQEVARRFADGRIATTIDRVDDIANDLFEMHHPDLKADNAARADFVADIRSQGAGFGNWVAFDWDKSLVRYPEQQDHQDLRTFRNKNLITADEQTKLLNATVAVFGLSVGSNVVEQLTLSGIGGTLALGDFDRLSPSNLNRIKSSMGLVGMRKLDIVASKTSQIDPYIKQVHFHEGANQESLTRLAELQPDIIFDEIDDLATKALLRQFAARQRIPLIMATDVGDTSIIDVERYDLGTGVPFNGRLKGSEVDQLLEGALPPEQRQKLMGKIVGLRHVPDGATPESLGQLEELRHTISLLNEADELVREVDDLAAKQLLEGGLSFEQRQRMMTKIVGLRHASARLLDSAMETNKTLGGLPQLGATASMGGSLSAVAAREIIIGRRLDSGRYVHSPKKTLRLGRQTTLPDSLATLRRFVKNKPQ